MSARGLALGPVTERLLRQVATRLRLAGLGRRFHLAFLAFAAAYALLLLVSRLLALLPDGFAPLTLLVLPGGALILALVLHRRPTAVEAARLIDSRADSRDLFLTAALLDTAPGDYKPLVLEQAEQRAAALRPAQLLPYRWHARARDLLVALAALLLGILFLPQLDPFGKQRARQQVANQRRELEETRKATALRVALLKKEPPDAKLSEQVQRGLDELKQALQQVKPEQKPGNFQRLADAQKPLNDLWRLRSEERLRDAFDRLQDAQTLGVGRSEKAEQWKRRLQRGDAAELKKELREMADQARQLAQLSNPAERQKAQQELKQRMRDLADFFATTACSKSVEQTVQRALEQLTQADKKELTHEALDALKETLELANLEVDKLAQTLRELQALEQGLKAAQLAKLVNALKGLDGKGCEGFGDIGDYAEFYKKLLEEARLAQGEGGEGGEPGQGPGGGMGGPGTGEGGKAGEKSDARTDFQSERSRSALQAGKILLQWKTTEQADPGTAQERYRQHLEAVKQGTREAILQEQVPPGYHDAIKKYFDSLGETREQP